MNNKQYNITSITQFKHFGPLASTHTGRSFQKIRFTAM